MKKRIPKTKNSTEGSLAGGCIVVLALSVFIFSIVPIAKASIDDIYEGAIIAIRGDVQVDTNGDGTWIRPWVGMRLMEDAAVRTERASIVDMVFDAEGLNIVRIGENSLTTIKKAVLELPEGEVIVNFANLLPGSSFTVRTPTAACAIRGSSMGVDVRDGKTTAKAFSGNVYVQGLGPDGDPVGPEHTVPEGSKAGVGGDGDVEDPEDLDSDDQAGHSAFMADTDTGLPSGTDGLPGDDDVDMIDTKNIDEIRGGFVDSDDTTQISPTGETPNGFSPGDGDSDWNNYLVR